MIFLVSRPPHFSIVTTGIAARGMFPAYGCYFMESIFYSAFFSVRTRTSLLAVKEMRFGFPSSFANWISSQLTVVDCVPRQRCVFNLSSELSTLALHQFFIRKGASPQMQAAITQAGVFSVVFIEMKIDNSFVVTMLSGIVVNGTQPVFTSSLSLAKSVGHVQVMQLSFLNTHILAANWDLGAFPRRFVNCRLRCCLEFNRSRGAACYLREWESSSVLQSAHSFLPCRCQI